MSILVSLIFILLVLGSSGINIYTAIKRKEKSTLWMQIGILGLVITGGIWSIYRVPDPSIAKILGIVIPRIK